MLTSLSVAIAWFLLAIPILSFPTILPATETNMNCKLPRSLGALS